MKPRHRWFTADSMVNGGSVERCNRCDTERTRDPATTSLYLYRRGRALRPNGRPLSEEWAAFRAGTVPACPMDSEAAIAEPISPDERLDRMAADVGTLTALLREVLASARLRRSFSDVIRTAVEKPNAGDDYYERHKALALEVDRLQNEAGKTRNAALEEAATTVEEAPASFNRNDHADRIRRLKRRAQ